MTFRAIILGFAGVILLSLFGYWNDFYLKQTYWVGNHLPPIIYGSLILFLLCINPLLARLGKGLSFKASELAVVLVIMMAACCMQGSGFYRMFAPLIVAPHNAVQSEPGWREANVLDKVPGNLLVDPEAEDGRAVSGFVNGLSTANQNISLADIPWEALKGPLSAWLPMVGIFWVGLIGLALLFHKQWSDHEHLPYPIASITHSLLPSSGQSVLGTIFSNRGFQIAAGFVILLHLVNFCYSHFDILIQISREIKLSSLFENTSANFRQAARLDRILDFKLYFSVIGIAYILAKDVSFSVGIGPIVKGIIVGLFATAGYPLVAGGPESPLIFFLAGAVFALFLAILYTGRHYYLRTLKQAFIPGSADARDDNTAAIWGTRLYAVCCVVFIGLMTATGLDWQIAILIAFILTVVQIVMSRVLAETGMFFIQLIVSPAIIITGFMGVQALGPETVALMGLISVVLMADPREAFMPFIVNGFKILNLSKVQPLRMAPLCVIALIAGLVIAGGASLYLQYNHGTLAVDTGWAYNSVAKKPFANALKAEQRLEAQNMLEQAESLSGWERFAHISPDKNAMIALGLGLILTLGFAYCRLRIPGWPIHPIIFALSMTYASEKFGTCFLLGWMVKVLVTKYGGDSGFQKLKPVMIGLVAGEILATILTLIMSTALYLITDSLPNMSGYDYIFPQ